MEGRLGKLGNGSPARAVVRAFDLMEVAEREIAAAFEKDTPGWRESFRLLMPGALADYSDALYAAHCRELLRRVARGEDTRPGTDAELCAVVCEASLKSPLSGLYVRVYEEAFSRCYGRLPGGAEPLAYSAYPGEVEQAVRELRSKLSQDWRRPNPGLGG